MNRRNFVRTAAMLPLAAGTALRGFGAAGVEAATLHGVDGGDGLLQRRFALTLDRVQHGSSPEYTEEFVLADVRPTPERRFTEFSGDVSGRYIGALATAARVFGTDAPQLDGLVDKVIALQKPDGYFGAAFHYDAMTDADMALLWGNGRLLVGLLEYWQLRKKPEVLAASVRLGNFLVRIGPRMLSPEMRAQFGAQHFAASYICWTQQTEGLALLYSATKDERYRRLAEQIAAAIERRPGDHVHGYLTSLRGVMDLHAETGDAKLLQQCEAAWEDISASKDLLITGGVPEGWSPNNHRTEGCGEADWVRLNLALCKATGKERYRAMAERAIFNELAFNQYATGDFGHRVYTETGLPAAGAVRAWWCCTLHGLRCFPDIQESVFQVKDGGLYYDLPLSGIVDGGAFAARADSKIIEDGSVRITITRASKEPAVLALRKPEWADAIEAKLKGSGELMPVEEGYSGAKRVWNTGDVVEVDYKMSLKAQPQANGRTAYWFGPWLLGAPAAENPAYFNELTTENRLLGEAVTDQKAVPGPAGSFAVPVAATVFKYAQAEYPDQPGTVQMRAIAEQTGQATTSWELRFLTGEKTS